MNKAEFLTAQAAAERKIKRRCIPLGLLYAIESGMFLGTICLSILLWLFFQTEAQTIILGELVFCILLFLVCFPAERDAKRAFVRLSPKCPGCQRCLAFDRSEKLLNTGSCPDCAVRIFDV